MSAQLAFVFYLSFSLVLFPFSILNLLIVNTPFFASLNSFIIKSNSMFPSLSQGSVVYTLKKSEYKKGEIVTFEDSLGTVAHRIIGETMVGETKYYVTKGDANLVTDEELIPSENVHGKIFFTLPFVGTLFLLLKSQYIILLGAVLPALFLPRLKLSKSRL